MAIRLSKIGTLDTTICSSTDQIHAALPQAVRPIFRELKHALTPPRDAPGCRLVIEASREVLSSYLQLLNADASDSLPVIVDSIELLCEEIGKINMPLFSQQTMRRRLTSHEAWALFLVLKDTSLPAPVVERVGAELARALATHSRFSPSLAGHLRQAIDHDTDLSNPNCVASKLLSSSLRPANTIFKRASATPMAPTTPREYADELTRWFRNRIHYASNKSQQAHAHHRTQSLPQFVASGISLRKRVEAGDRLAAAICIGGLFQLRADLVMGAPLLDAHTDPDYLIVVDIDNGTLHFSLALFAARGAPASTTTSPDANEPSARIFVSPVPAFLAKFLRSCREENPDARYLRDLLSSDQPLTKITPTLSQVGMIAASYPRFVNTFGAQAVALGIDRYVSAVLTHDHRIVPTGKFFYALCTREETWQAATTLFAALGWGEPVPLAPGLPGGSQTVPTLDAVSQWAEWIASEVNSARPTGEPTEEQLLQFHNTYAKASASHTSFFLVLRERREIPLTGQSVSGRGVAIAMGDKATGSIPGPRSVPLCRIVEEALGKFLCHLKAFDASLAALGQPQSTPVRKHIRQILEGRRVALYFEVIDGRVCPIGTSDLENWWPAEFGMRGNGGRHYFQNGLRRFQVFASDIDFYVRHSLRGVAPTSSASLTSLTSIAARVIPAMDTVAHEVGLAAVPGLASVLEIQ